MPGRAGSHPLPGRRGNDVWASPSRIRVARSSRAGPGGGRGAAAAYGAVYAPTACCPWLRLGGSPGMAARMSVHRLQVPPSGPTATPL